MIEKKPKFLTTYPPPLVNAVIPFCVSDQAWVTLDRIQFVGACNPPTDPGRKPLAHRFLRHVPVRYLTKL